jgi:pimeloyl-ACP methyl ester carboxylesterase
MKYTKYGYRINQITEGPDYNWIFLPSGPGLGSDYLIEFCQNLKLPGSILLVDFPMDGTNQQGELDFQYWQNGLMDLLKTHPNSILVTHGFSGMFVLNIPELAPHLSGLVLMNTTTENSFFQHIREVQQKHNLPDLVPAASAYHLNPTNETYKEFWQTYKYYFFTTEEMQLSEKIIPLFAFNNSAYLYAIQNFYPTYKCKLDLTHIPIMTIASENDYICPPQIFMHNQKFQSKNIMNVIIPQAGHCPWVRHYEQVQSCFNQYIVNYPDLG